MVLLKGNMNNFLSEIPLKFENFYSVEYCTTLTTAYLSDVAVVYVVHVPLRTYDDASSSFVIDDDRACLYARRYLAMGKGSRSRS